MKFLRISILTALHVCLIFLHTSCIREEMNACVQYKLNTQAVDEQGNDLTGNGILEKSEVYLFGEKGFIRMIPAKASLEYLFGNHKRKADTRSMGKHQGRHLDYYPHPAGNLHRKCTPETEKTYRRQPSACNGYVLLPQGAE